MLNLQKLLYSPNTIPSQVQAELGKVFLQTCVEDRNEPLFNFQIRCEDSTRTRLIIRFGYSTKLARWFFEPLKGN